MGIGTELRQREGDSGTHIHGLLAYIKLVIVELRVPEVNWDTDREDPGERGGRGRRDGDRAFLWSPM
jgi:hypothetical protein